MTILVDEKSRADRSAQTSLGRESDWSTAVAGFEGTSPNFMKHLDFALKAAGKGKSDYDGTGSTTRPDRANTQITGDFEALLLTQVLKALRRIVPEAPEAEGGGQRHPYLDVRRVPRHGSDTPGTASAWAPRSGATSSSSGRPAHGRPARTAGHDPPLDRPPSCR